MRVWAVLSFLAVLVGPAAAEHQPPIFELPEVIVPGRRPQQVGATPASVSVITRADLERLGARTVADALRLLPETVVRSYGGPGSLREASLRGFGPGQVLILLDGVPLNNVALGQVDLSTISTAGIERIEVLRGPFGALSGSGAVGGVINVVSAGPRRAAQAHGGGYGYQSIGFSMGGGPGSLTIETASARGHRPNSDYAGGTVVFQLQPVPSVHLSAHYYTADLGTPGDAALPTPADRQAQRRAVGQLRWEGGRTRVRFFVSGEWLGFRSPFGDSTYGSTVLGGEAQRIWELAPGREVVAGVEASRATLDALVFGAPIARSVTSGALTLQYDAVWSLRMLSSLGVRLDTHSAYGVALNPRLGVVYAPDEQTRIRASLGRTFRGPTFLHLYFPGCSNPALRPETVWSAEVGLERDLGRWLVGGTLFAAEAVDLISGGCPPQNIGAASIRGTSIELRGAVSPTVAARFHATFQQAVDRATGRALPRVPSATAGATLIYEPHSGISFVVSVLYVGARADQDFAAFPPAAVAMPPYLDVQLRVHTVTRSAWTLTVGVDNALDARIEAVKGFPAPGRTLFMTVAKRY